MNVAERMFSIVGSTLTRPANTTAYAANDAVSNHGTAGSVTPITFEKVAESRSHPVALTELLLMSTDTGFAGVSVRAWFFNSDPTASSGVGAGDNSAFSQKQAGFIGTMSGALRTFSDGSGGRLVPDEGSYIIANPKDDDKTIYMLLQTLGAATPSANSTTFTPRLRGISGRN